MAKYSRQCRKFSRIYDENIEPIFRFILLKVGSRDSTEDLTSLVFAKCWQKFKQNGQDGQEIKNPTAYLYQIARAEIANFYRKKSKFEIISTSSYLVENLIDPSSNVEEKAQLNSRVGKLKNCLSNLNKENQDMVIWRYLENMPIKTISQITKRPKGTVRVMLHRALKELKEKMENDENRVKDL